MPRVTIVGAGNMGRGIGTRAVAGGNDVEIVDHDPMEARQLAAELGATALEPGARLGGQVVVFAGYYPGIKDAVGQYADQLAGKVVVDITNPVDTQTWDRLATPPGTSSAEEVQQLVPQGTPVVKAFNTTFASTLVAVEVGGQQAESRRHGALIGFDMTAPTGGLVPNDEAGRHPLLERLDAFIGEWSIEASFGPASTGRAVFEWALGGQFLMERSEVPDVPEAPDGIAIIGVDRDGEAYTQHYFDSRGVARVYAMTFRDGVWTLLRDAPDFTPLDFWQRFTGEFSADGGTISGRWEISQDGSTWEHDFDLTYRKVT